MNTLIDSGNKLPHKSNFLILFVLLPLLLSTRCTKDEPGIDILEESKHFIIRSNSQHTSHDEVRLVKAQAEWLYDEIRKIFGEEWNLDKKIVILMEGSANEHGPFFDTAGIHLFRYSPEENGYLALLAHEMVHAFQEPFYIEKKTWTWSTYGYYDEGFAEYVAQLVEPNKTGYPFYGFPEHVVVGDLVKKERMIPHHLLRTQHEKLNESCKLQAYPVRASWFRHLDEVFGRAKMLSFIHPEEEPSSALMQALTGFDLETIDQKWQNWVVAKYEMVQGADEIAQQYRDRTSWYSYCP